MFRELELARGLELVREWESVGDLELVQQLELVRELEGFCPCAGIFWKVAKKMQQWLFPVNELFLLVLVNQFGSQIQPK